MSEYRIQIVHAGTGRVASWAPGRAVEADFLEVVTDAVLAALPEVRDLPDKAFVDAVVAQVKLRGVGWRPASHVIGDVQDALAAVILDLPPVNRPIESMLRQKILLALTSWLHSLKRQVRPA